MHIDGIGLFGNVVLCDDIRKEDNGKYLILGVYSSILTAYQIPGAVHLRVFAEFQAASLGEMRLDFEFRNDGNTVARFDGSIDQVARDDNCPQFIPLALPTARIDIPDECTLDLYAISDSNEAKIRSIRITKWIDTVPRP